MTASGSFAEFLCEQLSPIGHIAPRRMFGATGLFHGGVMFGIVSDDIFYVRVDEQSRAFFGEAQESPPLSYEKGGRSIDLSFWRVPERLLDEREELLMWARAALAAAHRVAAKRKKPARPRKARE